ncbi:MAG: SDR family oxidoreductase [Phycisphaerales bacterium]|jgi:nucleoside-diphosphate-sugar epimerase|nr:SDR family oxidoreductase [Phycisphaerales bacterium]MBT7171318.1 SDR family oxidoreductase [Phycisphaerales bacterium]
MPHYLITGGAGFIGSNLARYLLDRGQKVTVLDNLATGHLHNLQSFRDQIEFIEGDIRDADTVAKAMAGCDGISHQAALGSVPRSINDPLATHDVNVNGTITVLNVARKMGIKRVVLAASSSVYGRQEVSPKHEGLVTQPISPYAASKVSCEAYAQGFAAAYGMETVCLRYFNVFGPQQDPNGAYAAAIPRFVSALLAGERPTIYGDGTQSRDFCYIENVCHANLLALTAPGDNCDGLPMNIACNQKVSLNEILVKLNALLETDLQPIYDPPRTGDIKHSLAALDRAKAMIGYEPQVFFEEGLERAIAWYRQSQ